MSRTDHARKRRAGLHFPSVRRIRLYDGTIAFQSTCDHCGMQGPTRSGWHEAHTDSRHHYLALYGQPVAAVQS